MMCLGVDFFLLLVLWLYGFTVLIKFEKNLVIIFKKNLLSPLFWEVQLYIQLTTEKNMGLNCMDPFKCRFFFNTAQYYIYMCFLFLMIFLTHFLFFSLL